MPQTSSRITRSTLDADRTISTGSIRVHNIYVSNPTSTGAEIVFTDADGTPILNMTVKDCDSEQFPGAWIADNGLKVLGLGDANIVVTILHGAVGA